jgi:Lrp/AsnC family transcriptional regulator for asnA, asnC and gidA
MVHQRIEKMKEAGIIEGSQIKLNLKNLGYDVTVFLGVHLKSSKKLPDVIKKLKNYPEVLEAHYTTGTYALLLKISTRNISDFHKFLIEKLQSIDEVQSTESFISMDQPIQKGISL